MARNWDPCVDNQLPVSGPIINEMPPQKAPTLLPSSILSLSFPSILTLLSPPFLPFFLLPQASFPFPSCISLASNSPLVLYP